MANQTTAPAPGRSGIDRFFKITERGSTVGREIRGGLVTFFAMSYIIVLNPLIIGTVQDGTGQVLGGGTEATPDSLGMVAAATALVAGLVTILMGVFANFPIALAAGLGLNAVVAFSIAGLPDVTWADAMGLVVIEGLIILVLVLTGFREAVFNAVPFELKTAISVGIGLFIALIGFVNAGFVVPGAGTPLALGNLGTWPILVFVVGLLLVIALFVRKIRGAMFWGILAATVLAVVLENTLHIGTKAGGNPNGFNLNAPTFDGVVNVPTSACSASSRCWARSTTSRSSPSSCSSSRSSSRTSSTRWAPWSPSVPRPTCSTRRGTRRAPAPSSSSTPSPRPSAAWARCPPTPRTSSPRPASGDGARTGLASVTTGAAFLLATFLAPLVALVPYEAAAPALVFVGYLMMMQVANISWRNVEIAIPAFLTIVLMPFTYSIADGIGAGFLAFVVIKLALGKVRELHWLMWVASLMFVVYFLMEPIQNAIG